MLSQAQCVAMTLQFMAESEHARIAQAKRDADQAWIELNNLYLAVQKGTTRMSITVSNTLRVLVGKAYPSGEDSFIRDHWADEFRKLPRWNDF